MSAASNERIKLTANLLNAVAAFSITAGGVGPLIALSYGLNAPTGVRPLALGLILTIWIAFGIGLHLLARWVARKLT